MPARLRLPILGDRGMNAHEAESGAHIPGIVSIVVRWKRWQAVWPMPPDSGSRLCGLHEEGPRVAAGEAWGR